MFIVVRSVICIKKIRLMFDSFPVFTSFQNNESFLQHPPNVTNEVFFKVSLKISGFKLIQCVYTLLMLKLSYLWLVGASLNWFLSFFVASLLVVWCNIPASSGTFSAPGLKLAVSPRSSVFFSENVILEMQLGF